LGLTHLVYPGALHTRFHHSMGAMYLMSQAIEILRAKGHNITNVEANGTYIAILLHDIGHGPYSHTLEHSIVSGVKHEEISDIYMQKLNQIFKGKLSLAIQIFNNKYKKKFLHQLVSSQLDMDRMDYLKRDSFYTGVSEGIINADRIIKMLDVVDDKLVVEAKGIYSIEKFIIARRLMYWQVYLHKTAIGAEYMLRKILTRAKQLTKKGNELFASPALTFFLQNEIDKKQFIENPEVLDYFSQLDDFDIFTSIKVWANHNDFILSNLCKNLVDRKLFKIEIQNEAFAPQYIEQIKQGTKTLLGLEPEMMEFFVFNDTTSNFTFDPGSGSIDILFKNGETSDLEKASDQLNISFLTKPITKHFICYPKEVFRKLTNKSR
jgi:uncharacterized protein